MDLDAFRTGPLKDRSDPAPIISRETVFDGKVWDIVRDTVTFGGKPMVREYVAHTGAVAVLALDEHDRVLLINQYRQPLELREWELPAGLLDIPGEDPLVAAQRELGEEADLVAAEWTALTRFHSSPGGSNEVITIFQARGLSATETPHDRTDEEAEIVTRWVPLAEVLDAVAAGHITNAILMIAVLTAHAQR
ncbi:MAG: NUDIX hydrolase [Pseudolysinimonas sp.]|uniref:NUDIX hydrolase n=1 Tax=Pseudolysinimonas sp. TaxID=2680009 RepID=UPI0032636AF9